MADISTPSGQYTEYESKRELPRALMGGTAKMREEGHKFLPQFPAESDESYKVRLNSTTLYNGFSDTIKKMVGKVFSKNIQLNPDIPPQIVELMPNIDGQGRNHTAFFLDAFRDAMIDGVSFVFVDFPVVTPATDGQSPTMADQQAQGARPNTVLICAENLIDWDHKSIGGAEILTEVRIKEKFTEQDPSNAWAEIEIEQIRLLRPGSFEIWRKVKDNTIHAKWDLHDEGTTSLSYIPLIPIYTNRTGYYCGEPPLMPLAELNQEHWISTSEQRKALTFARFAMLVLSGVNPDSNVDVGPDKVLKVPQGASAAYAEPSGTGIEAGRLDLEAIEARMQHAGMSIQVQTQVGNVTATATAIGSYESNSALMAAATSLEDSINQVLQVFADYMGLSDGGSVTINKTFGQMLATGTIPELVTLHTAGLVSTETIMSELKRRGMLDESVDTEAEIERISSQMYGGMSAPVEQPVQSTLEAIEQPVIEPLS